MLKHPAVAEVDLLLDNLLDSMVVVLVVLEVQVVVDTITKVMVAQVADKHLVDLDNGSGGTGCNQAGGGAGPGSNGYDARPYGYDDQNLNLPGIAPHQGYFCSGGGNTRAPGTGTPGTGNGSYGTNHGGHGVAVVKVGSASGFVDKTFNQSFDTEGNH